MALRDKHERPGRNPQTGMAITIEARRVLSFKSSPTLKETLNPLVDVPEDDARFMPWSTSYVRRPARSPVVVRH